MAVYSLQALLKNLISDLGLEKGIFTYLLKRTRSEGLSFLTKTLPGIHDSIMHMIENNIPFIKNNWKDSFIGQCVSWSSPLGKWFRDTLNDLEPKRLYVLRQLLLFFKKLKIHYSEDSHNEKHVAKQREACLRGFELSEDRIGEVLELGRTDQKGYLRALRSVRELLDDSVYVLPESDRHSSSSVYPCERDNITRPEQKNSIYLKRRNGGKGYPKVWSSHSELCSDYFSDLVFNHGPGSVSSAITEKTYEGINPVARNSDSGSSKCCRDQLDQSTLTKLSLKSAKYGVFVPRHSHLIDETSENYYFSGSEFFPESKEAEWLDVFKDANKRRGILKCPPSAILAQSILFRSGVESLTRVNPGMSLYSQEVNRDKALRSSRSQEMATIDLTAASDSIPWEYLEEYLRGSPQFQLLSRARISEYLLPSSSSLGEKVTRYVLKDLLPHWHLIGKKIVKSFGKRNYRRKTFNLYYAKKAFSMGQYMVMPEMGRYIRDIYVLGRFLNDYEGCYLDLVSDSPRIIHRVRKCLFAYANDITVYGDDIVIPSMDYVWFLSALEKAGFTPNRRKSFCFSKFRESCGINAFDGVDVTETRLQGPEFSFDPKKMLLEVADDPRIIETSRRLFDIGLVSLSRYLIESESLQVITKKTILRQKIKKPVYLAALGIHSYLSERSFEYKWILSSSSYKSPAMGISSDVSSMNYHPLWRDYNPEKRYNYTSDSKLIDNLFWSDDDFLYQRWLIRNGSTPYQQQRQTDSGLAHTLESEDKVDINQPMYSRDWWERIRKGNPGYYRRNFKLYHLFESIDFNFDDLASKLIIEHGSFSRKDIR